jgi:hypothetical protein
MGAYVDKNTALRQKATNDADVAFPKLMNNSLYGKMCENVLRRTNIHLVEGEKEALRHIKKPQCINFRQFENMFAVELRKTDPLINKPTYIVFTILEYAKLEIYKFYYDVLKNYYGNKLKLLMTGNISQ